MGGAKDAKGAKGAQEPRREPGARGARERQTPERVRDLMTAQVATLELNDKLKLADDVMRLGRIRHMPVLDDEGAIVGIVSQRDLFRGALARCIGYGEFAQQKLLDQLVVKEVMSTGVAIVEPTAPLEDAARLMIERKIGCVVVAEEGRLVGILTESDFVRLYATPREGAHARR
ncbi:MAG TPA: CBS domain-containing protein [Myxococcota bacterium]|nr:CBS domain-containing protein [Myxococcota bacterium]